MSSRCLARRRKPLLHAWLQENCPRHRAAGFRPKGMRQGRARSSAAPRSRTALTDLSYLRLTALAAHAREHGYDERIAHQAFEVFLTAAQPAASRSRDVANPALTRPASTLPTGPRSAMANADLARIGLDQAFTVSLECPADRWRPRPHRLCFERLARAN